jgi:hypothetical protein
LTSLCLSQSKFVVDKYEKAKSRYPGKGLKSSGSLIKWIEEKAIPLVGLKKLGTAGKSDFLSSFLIVLTLSLCLSLSVFSDMMT